MHHPTPTFKPSWIVLRKESTGGAGEPATDLKMRPLGTLPEVKIDMPEDPADQALSLATPEHFATPEECQTPEGYPETKIDVEIEVVSRARDSGVSVEEEQEDEQED